MSEPLISDLVMKTTIVFFFSLALVAFIAWSCRKYDERVARDRREAEARRRRNGELEVERKTAQRRAQLEELRVTFESFEHYEDPAFVRRYATKHRERLLSEREEIVRPWVELHRDLQLVSQLKAAYPEVYARMSWQVRAVARAEQIDVEPPPRPESPPPQPPPPPQPKRRKPSAPPPGPIVEGVIVEPAEAEEDRDARDLRREEEAIERRARLELARILATLRMQKEAEAAIRETGADADTVDQTLGLFMERLAGHENGAGDYERH